LSEWITSAGLPVSLAAGAAVVALALLGVAYWPAVFAAGWLSAIALGYPPQIAAPLAAIGLMEALMGMAMLQRAETLPGISRSVLLSLIAAAVPAIGATLTVA